MRLERVGRPVFGAGGLDNDSQSGWETTTLTRPQAVDFSILAIAVVTLLTIQFKSYILYASTPKKILICLSIWIVPLITSACHFPNSF